MFYEDDAVNFEKLPNTEMTSFEQDAMILAGQAHGEWCAGRTIMLDGSYEPRPKKTKDEVWIAAHGGVDEPDIANTAFADLPADHQQENLDSARVALKEAYMIGFYGEGQYGDRNFMHFEHHTDYAGNVIHIKWLDRNGAWAPDSQKLPFHSLSEEEKDKDRAIYIGAADIVNQRLVDGSLEVPGDMLFEALQQDFEAFPAIVAYLQGSYGEGWQPRVGDVERVSDDEVRLDLDIDYDNLHLHGVYPLTMVAKLARGLRNRSPEHEDGLRAVAGDTVRRRMIGEILTSHAT
jgi:hypothetical protein